MFKRTLTLALLFFACPALAAGSVEATYQEDKPVAYEADWAYYDKAENILYAKGDVLIEQEGQKLYADEVVFERNKELMYARGHVKLMKSDGSVYYSDEAKFYQKIHKGFIVDFKGQMEGNAKIAAKSAEMIDKDHMNLGDFVYSTCDVCESNFIANTPIWQIRADKGDLDKTEERVYYKNARVNLLGVPAFYTPYFSTPAPGAKRKSGVLFPKFKINSHYGFSATIPIYFNLAPDYDATYSPQINSKYDPLHHLEFRHLLKNGEYILKTSYLNKYRPSTGTKQIDSTNTSYRSYFKLDGNYRFDGNKFYNGYLNFSAQYLREPGANKVFLKKFDINQADYLKSDVKYLHFAPDNYYIIRGLHFQDLRPGYSTKTTPSAIPTFDGYYEKELGFMKSKIFTELNTLNLRRIIGASYDRISIKPGVNSDYYSNFGAILGFKAFVRNDIYNIKNTAVPQALRATTTQSLNKQGGEYRSYPEVSAEARMPFYARVMNQSLILEPMVTAAVSSLIKNLKKVGNEDSLDPEISPGNIMLPNRFNGYDRVETGARANVGARASLHSKYYDNLSVFIGQAFRAKADKNFTKKSGLYGKNSNYVTKVSLSINEYLNFISNSRFNNKSYKMLKNEFTASLTFKKLTLNLIHVYSDRSIINVLDSKYGQEVITSAAYNFYDKWWVNGNMHRRLGKKPINERTALVTIGSGLKYDGNCLIAEFGISRNYTKMIDLKPSSTYLFNIIIPTF